jgi:FkbM family methyltransferase
VVPLGQSSRIIASLDYPNSVVTAYANPPDAAEWSAWRRHLRSGDVFVDVGANVGVYSILAAELGCQVIAFEPDATNLRALRENIRLNGYEDRITVVPMAAADQPGVVAFTAGDGPLARIAPPGTPGTGEVVATTIDSEIAIGIGGMKIDVEGGELAVLQGATALLSDGRCPLIQVEWNDVSRFGRSRADEATFLIKHGFELLRPDADGHLFPSDAVLGADIFALRSSRTTNRGTVAPS